MKKEIGRISKTNEKFNFTDQELLALNQRVFRNYLLNQVGYDKSEIPILMRLHNAYLNKDNIRKYINYSAAVLYSALIRDELENIANLEKLY